MTSTKTPPRASDGPAQLSMEAAVACRVIRAGILPAQLFYGLAGIAGAEPCQGVGLEEFCDPRVTAAIDEIILPVQADANHAEQRESRCSAQWLAAACRCAAEQYTQLQLRIGPRLLVASLLPLYRCLATNRLTEGLWQCQSRLAELLSLLALCHEVGDELCEVLDRRNRRLNSPHSILSHQFNLNLTRVAELAGEIAASFDSANRQFSSDSVDRLLRLDPTRSQNAPPDWAAPDLLWKLSGELLSNSSELLLPRSWVDIPVPWSSVADHWRKLNDQLSGQPNDPLSTAEVEDATLIDQAVPDAPFPSSTTPYRSTTESIVESAASRQTRASSAAATIPTDGSPAEIVSDEEKTLRSVEAISALIESGESSSVDPKVLIAEIYSHNDPVFVNVIRRQIGKCRTEDRAVSLVSMVVLPEDEDEHQPIHENGLKRWQQKLVNWLAEHPQVTEPHAFLTTAGELLLCLLDLERNETTALVRHALVEVLTGQHLDADRGNVLATVNVPARYHAGIASTSSPGAGFAPEQLIEPAIRCLSAASAHGKASIKSIEVY